MKPDFPSLADEIAEPNPDMNIKVASFTISEKSSNTNRMCSARTPYINFIGDETGFNAGARYA